MLRLDEFQYIEAVQAWNVDVQENQVGARLMVQERQGLLAVRGAANVDCTQALPEYEFDKGKVAVIVLYRKY